MGICGGLERTQRVSSSCPLRRTPRCRRGLSRSSWRGGVGDASPGLVTPRQIFPPTWAARLSGCSLAGTHSIYGAERAARPWPFQSALPAHPSGNSSIVGFAEVETSLKWLCACKLRLQPGTPPLVLLTSLLTSAQFTLTPPNPLFYTEPCRRGEQTTDYKEHSTGFLQGPSFPLLGERLGGGRNRGAAGAGRPPPGPGSGTRGAPAAGLGTFTRKRPG